MAPIDFYAITFGFSLQVYDKKVMRPACSSVSNNVARNSK